MRSNKTWFCQLTIERVPSDEKTREMDASRCDRVRSALSDMEVDILTVNNRARDLQLELEGVAPLTRSTEELHKMIARAFRHAHVDSKWRPLVVPWQHRYASRPQ